MSGYPLPRRHFHYGNIIFGMVFYWRLRRAGSITMRKTTMVLMGIALIAVAAPNWAGGKFILNNKGYLS